MISTRTLNSSLLESIVDIYIKYELKMKRYIPLIARVSDSEKQGLIQTRLQSRIDITRNVKYESGQNATYRALFEFLT